uniref:UBIQUITIN_CONJUGAT_2 domain-containing protein n=1 Tax=Caenorhabditis tropicalis TaxID=1561998 RepID=A0A1I7T039_9PELO
MTEMYNTKNAGVRRLMQEAKELSKPTEMYHAQPMEDNLFEWHFTIRGTIGTDFEGGIYHGRIIFPADYPMKPPNLILLTPNGRFELNKKICLSISGYHPETWLPSWSIRTALLALVGFLPSSPAGALGSLDYPPKERKRLAKLSADWKCKECGCLMKDALLPITEDGQSKVNEEAKKLATQVKFQDESVLKQQETATEETVERQEENETAETTVAVEASRETGTPNEPVLSESVHTEVPTPVTTSESMVQEPNQEQSSQLSHQLTARQLPSSNFDWSLLLKIPLALLCVAVFIILLARRVFVENESALRDVSEL